MHQVTTGHPSCRFCGSIELHESTEAVKHCGVDYTVMFCKQCGVGMTWPQPDVASLERFYAPGEYRAEEGKRFLAPVEWLFELQKKCLLVRLSGGLRRGSMVDIGCGSGYTASLFAKNGWAVTGVEFSDETAVHARETYQIHVVTSVASLSGPFDLILVNHCLRCPNHRDSRSACRDSSPAGHTAVVRPLQRDSLPIGC